MRCFVICLAFFVIWNILETSDCTTMCASIDDVHSFDRPLPCDFIQQYSRRQLYTLRAQGRSKSYIGTISCSGLLRYRGCRGGHLARQRRQARTNNNRFEYEWARAQKAVNQIEVVVNRKPCAREFSFNNNITVQPTPARPRQLHVIENLINVNTTINNNSGLIPPSIYLLNATSIAKPHAIQQLHADVLLNAVDVTIITESWLKAHHPDSSAVSIPGYSIFRRIGGNERVVELQPTSNRD